MNIVLSKNTKDSLFNKLLYRCQGDKMMASANFLPAQKVIVDYVQNNYRTIRKKTTIRNGISKKIVFIRITDIIPSLRERLK